ncbi:MAG: YihY/virulence factor BrkB family protein [Bacteroidales bacterium]|nr:YihY/virulence factor BrkB family protein [Bacteroidales bacterium]MCM1414390.1 YihY/virulence factor BrkB family protein [bacterium]MCM1422270.1 YihY/virulence factor BrkB family protein [bacterium]
MIYRLFLIFRDFNWQMTKKNISAFAASTAFFLFLSIIPLLMALCAILPFTSLTEANLITAITQFTPDAVDGLVVRVVSDVYDRSAGTITVFAIVTIWSAAKAMLALIHGLNAVNDVEEKRNYFVLRMIACFYTVVILAAMLVALFVMVFGNVIVDLLLKDIPPLYLVVRLVMRFRFLISWAVLTLIFALIYAFVPSTKLRFKAQLPGAAFAAALWGIASFAFSVYVDHYNNFGTYGSLTTVVILMLWFYMLMYILMIGAHINRYFGPVYKFLFGWLDKSGENHYNNR